MSHLSAGQVLPDRRADRCCRTDFDGGVIERETNCCTEAVTKEGIRSELDPCIRPRTEAATTRRQLRARMACTDRARLTLQFTFQKRESNGRIGLEAAPELGFSVSEKRGTTGFARRRNFPSSKRGGLDIRLLFRALRLLSFSTERCLGHHEDDKTLGALSFPPSGRGRRS